MTTFVLLHGIPGSAASWHAVRDRLVPRHTVLAPDLLGFGDEPTPDGPDALLAQSQAHHVLEVIERSGAERVTLVGHDFGGPVAAHVVATAPERVAALALFATNAFPDTPIPFPLSTMKLPVIGGLFRSLLFSAPSLRMMLRRGVGRPRAALDVEHSLGDTGQRAAIRTIFGASLSRLRELYTPVETALRAVTVPTLVGWGERDPFFPVAIGRRTAEAIPGARFCLYEGAGHFLPEERPAEVAADLVALSALVEHR